ncbi:MAG TPA: alpha/beta hydrolase [Acidimicrobiia bacterium]|jgi:hypothetical protein|nr:alpha/beta hydrolase [Acidimicrobiia bacterium]
MSYLPGVVVTIDPRLVALLAAGLEEAAARLEGSVRAVQAVPGVGDIAPTLATLAAVVAQARSGAADLIRRADVVERSGQSPPPPWLSPAQIPLGAGLGRRSEVETRFGEALDADLDPGGWRRWFASRPAEEAGYLADRFPAVIGRLDGAPPSSRFLANRRLVALDLLRHSASLHRLVAARRNRGLPLPTRAAIGRAESGLRRKLEQLTRWHDRQILLYVPGANGRMVEVFGDLGRAETVVVVIPGVGSDITNVDQLSDAAARLATEVSALADHQVAVIAWLGYDSPDGLIPAGAGVAAACEAVPALAALVEGSTAPGARVVLVGHSYGSVAVGAALGANAVEAVAVLLGSPGTGAARAADLGPAVWAARASGDPIGVVPESIHGGDPTDPEFGASRFSTGGAAGHGLDQYLGEGTESLRNVALIAAGREDEVTMWSPPTWERLLVGITAPLLPLLAPLALARLASGVLPRPTCRRSLDR